MIYNQIFFKLWFYIFKIRITYDVQFTRHPIVLYLAFFLICQLSMIKPCQKFMIPIQLVRNLLALFFCRGIYNTYIFPQLPDFLGYKDLTSYAIFSIHYLKVPFSLIS
jgi:hypothetical protein